MFESDEEIAELQAIMGRSFERQGTHAAFIITPERRLSARQMVSYLNRDETHHSGDGDGEWRTT